MRRQTESHTVPLSLFQFDFFDAAESKGINIAGYDTPDNRHDEWAISG